MSVVVYVPTAMFLRGVFLFATTIYECGRRRRCTNKTILRLL
jgi:hypothetical protein